MPGATHRAASCWGSSRRIPPERRLQVRGQSSKRTIDDGLYHSGREAADPAVADTSVTWVNGETAKVPSVSELDPRQISPLRFRAEERTERCYSRINSNKEKETGPAILPGRPVLSHSWVDSKPTSPGLTALGSASLRGRARERQDELRGLRCRSVAGAYTG